MKKSAFLLILIFLFNSFSFAEEAAFKDLSSEEKLFCMLTSSIIENRGLSHDSLNPNKDITDLPAQILEQTWGVSSYYELINLLNKLYDYKSCDNYADFYTKILETQEQQKLQEPQNAQPLQAEELLQAEEQTASSPSLSDKSTISPLVSAAASYGIPFSKLCYFLYLPNLQDKLGESGTMAWHYGNALTALRLAIGANLIDEDEALGKAKPFIDAITNSFCSFEDYCCHYLFGISFFYSDRPEVMPSMVQESFNNFVPFFTKYSQLFPENCFHGKSGSSLTFEILVDSMQPEQLARCTEYISIFRPMAYYKNYENAGKVIDSYLSGSIKEDFYAIDGTPYFYELAGNILLNAGRLSDIQGFYEQAEDMLESLPKSGSLRSNIYMLYAFSAFTNEDYIKTIKLCEQISEGYEEIAEVYHIEALSYTYRFLDAEKANDSGLADEFLSKSIDLYVKAYKKGYQLSDKEQELIIRFSGQSIEELALPAPDFHKA
ncbi:MAG: DUF1266 domain-containing protein [Spirochaetaceae bacterium]|nr:DUF1266 domain-containing protein [Spirochaetaceae bacterium]